jgi:hypothetical protein
MPPSGRFASSIYVALRAKRLSSLGDDLHYLARLLLGTARARAPSHTCMHATGRGRRGWTGEGVVGGGGVELARGGIYTCSRPPDKPEAQTRRGKHKFALARPIPRHIGHVTRSAPKRTKFHTSIKKVIQTLANDSRARPIFVPRFHAHTVAISRASLRSFFISFFSSSRLSLSRAYPFARSLPYHLHSHTVHTYT